MALPYKTPTLTRWVGDDAPPLVWRFPFDLTGSDILLSLRFGGRVFHRSVSGGGLELDEENNRVTWRYVPADIVNRNGNAGRYELTRIVPGGETRTYAYGDMVVRNWING